MKIIIETKEFKRIVKALKPFTRIDNEKMQYIRLEVEKEAQEVKFEALDGHRIAVEYLKCEADESFIAYIKPFVFSTVNEKNTEIELFEDRVYVTTGDCRVGFKQLEGGWYDTALLVRKAEEEQPISRVGINAKMLIDALSGIKQKNGKDMAVIECRGNESPIIVRDLNDKRNIRMILPIRIIE